MQGSQLRSSTRYKSYSRSKMMRTRSSEASSFEFVDQALYRQRPLTGAEKQRNYRERLKQSPDKYEQFKKREAERQRQRNRTRNLTDEQVAVQRRKWRERVRKHRLKKKAEALLHAGQLQEAYSLVNSLNSSSMGEPIPEGLCAESLAGSEGGEMKQETFSIDGLQSGHQDSSESDMFSAVSIPGTCDRIKSDPYEETMTAEGNGNSVVSFADKTSYPSEIYCKEEQILDDNVTNMMEDSFRVVPNFRDAAGPERIAGVRNGKTGRRKRPQTAAERQRKYRERLKQSPEKWEEYKRKDAERRKKFHRKQHLPEDVLVQERRKARDRKRQYRTRVKDVSTQYKPKRKYTTNVTPKSNLVIENGCSDPKEQCPSDRGRDKIGSKRECKSGKKHQQASKRSEKNKSQSAEQDRLKKIEAQLSEARLALKRLKGRERVRKWRLKQKKEADRRARREGIPDPRNELPRIGDVWSMNDSVKWTSESNHSEITMTSSPTTQYGNRQEQIPANVITGNSVMPLVATHQQHWPMNMEHVQEISRQIGSVFPVDPTILMILPGQVATNSDLTNAGTTRCIYDSQPENQIRMEGQTTQGIFYVTKKAMTAAEKQRKYREKLKQDPERWAAYKQKEFERYMSRKAGMTQEQVNKNRRLTLVRTRRWRAKKKGKTHTEPIGVPYDSKMYKTLGNMLEEDVEVTESMSHTGRKKARYKWHTYCPEKSVGSGGEVKGQWRTLRSSEQIERIRRLDRERQRRHRAKKKFESMMQRSGTNFLEDITGDEEFESLTREPESEVNSDRVVDTQINDDTEMGRVASQLRSSRTMLSSLRSRSLLLNRKYDLAAIRRRVRPRKLCNSSQAEKQHKGLSGNGVPVKRKRGRSRRVFEAVYHTKTRNGEPALHEPTDEGRQMEVVVSSAGNIPVVISSPDMRSPWEQAEGEIPQIIPCDPPERDCEWGDLDLDSYPLIPEDDVTEDMGETFSAILDDGDDDACLSGSARRKAFFPTKHQTADLTLNAACAFSTHVVGN